MASLDWEKLWRLLSRYPNVVGVSNKLMPRIRGGREVPEEKCIRVYVSKKVPLAALKPEEVIPREVEGVPTDVVEVGEVRALSDKRGRFRPLLAGISIGSLRVTAGTLGWFFADERGEAYLGSNAHVFVPDPRVEPGRVEVLDIVQPAVADGGTPADRVAVYYWHKPIAPWRGESGCPVARLWAGVYNAVARVAGSKTRLLAVVEEANVVDFAVARPLVDFEKRTVDLEVSGKLVGLGFAGSNLVSVVCKASRIAELGFKPLDAEPADAREDSLVAKTGRTTCVTKGRILDSSATITVSYGPWTALFTDVVITTKLMEPGDSGSSVWISG